MFIIKYRKIFYALSTVLFVGSFVAIFVYGLNFGIDFKGGSSLEVNYVSFRPPLEDMKTNLNKLNLGSYTIAPTGDLGFILKTRDITPAEKQSIISALSPMTVTNGEMTLDTANEVQFNTLGPVVGAQLKNKAYLAILLVLICIVLFITIAFRKVSHPVASWKYGLANIVSLAHDVVIPTGVFVVWMHFKGGEIDLLFVTALLAILGYSVHDTIVVFDRIRENLRVGQSSKTKETFEETVGRSLTDTIGRSLSTSFTIFLVLMALYLLGGESTRDFAFVLLMGIISGTYSSIFIASPFLVTLEKLQKKT